MAKKATQPDSAVLYVRVSTREQAEHGRSLDAQEDALHRWCEKREPALKVISVCRDEGVSGTRRDRPGLAQALDLAMQEQGVLVVYSLSRAARSIHHLVEIARQLDKAGADFASVTEQFDTSSSMGKFLFHLFGCLAQFERDAIAERTAAAMEYKRSQREFRGGRRPPLGWMLDPDEDEDAKPRHVVPNPDEQEILRDIAECREDGMSATAIAAHLNSEGVDCPLLSGKTGAQATRWHHQGISRLLKRLDEILVPSLAPRDAAAISAAAG